MTPDTFERAVNDLVRNVHFPFEQVKKCWLLMKPNDLGDGLCLPKEICAKIRMFLAPPSYRDLPSFVSDKGQTLYEIMDSIMYVDEQECTVNFIERGINVLYGFKDGSLKPRERNEIDLASGVVINTCLDPDVVMVKDHFFFTNDLQFFLHDEFLLDRNTPFANIDLCDISNKIKHRGFANPVRAIYFTNKWYIESICVTRITMTIVHTSNRRHITIVWIDRTNNGAIAYTISRDSNGLNELVAIIMPVIELMI